MHSYPANDPAAILQQNVRKSLAISGVQSEYVTTKNKGGFRT
nr:MAG TPA: hypothetical protein [Caudoviricetes sp.]DAQ86793.1 MAG TPA: hypothetical protein [Caudoviricetes sp.]